MGRDRRRAASAAAAADTMTQCSVMRTMVQTARLRNRQGLRAMSFLRLMAVCLATITIGLQAKAEDRKAAYESSTRCEKIALNYYNENENSKNTTNNSFFYESYIESHFNAAEKKCFARTSAMMHQYRDDITTWRDTLIDIDGNTTIGTMIKVVDLRSNTVIDFQCDIRGEKCASRADFKSLVKPYMEN